MTTSPTSQKLIHGIFSFTFISFLSCTLYIWLLKSQQDTQRVKRTKVLAGLVTFIAAYHYLMILLSFNRAYKVVNNKVIQTGAQFEDNYRYVDWILTVPLLLIELVYAANHHNENDEEMHKQMIELGTASVLMIALGYPGELYKENFKVRMMWWCLSMIPFIYILVRIYQIIPWSSQDKELSRIRDLLVSIWFVYPIIYLLPKKYFIASQIGYSGADLVAKAVYGLMVVNYVSKPKMQSNNLS